MIKDVGLRSRAIQDHRKIVGYSFSAVSIMVYVRVIQSGDKARFPAVFGVADE